MRQLKCVLTNSTNHPRRCQANGTALYPLAKGGPGGGGGNMRDGELTMVLIGVVEGCCANSIVKPM
jgi:hypothetical protein